MLYFNRIILFIICLNIICVFLIGFHKLCLYWWNMILSFNRYLLLLLFNLKYLFDLLIQMMGLFVILSNCIIAIIHVNILEKKNFLTKCRVASKFRWKVFYILSFALIKLFISCPLGYKTHYFLTDS